MDKMVGVLGKIKPTLNDADVQSADIVVEAVVENPKVKKAVLSDLEKTLGDNAVNIKYVYYSY